MRINPQDLKLDFVWEMKEIILACLVRLNDDKSGKYEAAKLAKMIRKNEKARESFDRIALELSVFDTLD